MKLNTTINSRLIFKQKSLSFHTKSILNKMVTDIICGHEEASFLYMILNIFTAWPDDVVWTAIEELADNDIMYIDFNEDYEEEESGEYQMEELIFTPEFLERVYPSINFCQCCNPAPVNFNVNYN